MGLFSGITKGFKSIFSGVKKAFKSVVGSKIGKIVLIAAAVWLGGAALGAWKSGFASIDGALVASQTAGVAGSAAAPAAAATNAGGAGTAAVNSAASAATGGLGGAAGTPFGMAAPVVSAAPVITTAPPPGGFMNTTGKVVSGAAEWMEKNPIPTLLGGQALAGAFGPNKMDLNEQENKFKIDEENRRKQDVADMNARLAQVGGIPTVGYSGAQLPPPAGIMGRRLV